MDDRKFLSPQEIAAATGLSKPTVCRHIQQGQLKAIRVGAKQLAVPRAAAQRYIQAKTTSALED
jgi:excisionase family DNA binding protein